MKGTKRRIALIAAVAFTVAPAVAQAGDKDDISIIADACAGCHGTDARSPGEMPGFSDKTAEKIKNMLMEYKAGTKEATVMDRVVKAYSDQQLEALANHFAAANRK